MTTNRGPTLRFHSNGMMTERYGMMTARFGVETNRNVAQRIPRWLR
ncbi:MAG TPA: hypothetical protein VHS81_10015 [Caulobacteraceae bacterium]|nr:hypothetical protein [Caulobacteraceae bacterium]